MPSWRKARWLRQESRISRDAARHTVSAVFSNTIVGDALKMAEHWFTARIGMQQMMHTGRPLACQNAFLRAGRMLLSILVAITVLLSSLHHLSCLGEDVTSGAVASIALPSDQPPVNSDACLPGHCHCVCHLTADARVALLSTPVEFSQSIYSVSGDQFPRALAGYPPFEPPRA